MDFINIIQTANKIADFIVTHEGGTSRNPILEVYKGGKFRQGRHIIFDKG